jgi:F-type H+-transporting ATPase subunit delta
MRSGAIARRYAKALYELAREEKSSDIVGRGLREVADGVADARRLGFDEGVLDSNARRKVGDALAAKVSYESTLGRFLRLVAERDRLAYLPEIAEWYEQLEDEAAGRVRLAITAAVNLTPADVDAFRTAFRSIAKRDVVADVAVDPALLGGAVVELEGRVYDGSVRTALARLASRMSGANDAAGARVVAATPKRPKGKKNADQSV